MAIQIINTEQVGLLESHFQPRYDSAFAWKSAVSATLAMPGIIGAWPMSAVKRNSAVDRGRDVTGAGYHLTDTNGVLFGYAASSLIPIAEFLGTNEYLLRADGGVAAWADITGTETHIRATEQGLTIGGWFYLKDVTTTAMLMSKWDGVGGNNRSYMLYLDGATSELRFYVSSAGTAVSAAFVTGEIAVINNWHYVMGYFNNSENTINICVNGTVASGAYANTIFDSIADFVIGASGAPGNYMTGLASLCLLCQCGASDAQVLNLFHQTRAMVGV